MSYTNLILYSASLPNYKSPKSGRNGSKGNTIINGDDPRNQADIDRLFDESYRHS